MPSKAKKNQNNIKFEDGSVFKSQKYKSPDENRSKQILPKLNK